MLVGWTDESTSPIDCVRLVDRQWRLVLDGNSLVRVRRRDVEAALGSNELRPYGFFSLVHAPDLIDVSESCAVEIWLKNGTFVTHQPPIRVVSDVELRNLILGYLASAEFFGNQRIEAISGISSGTGKQILDLNRAITSRFTSAPYVERFGTAHRKPRGSIVVCLYGKTEFLPIQNCLFAGRPGIEDYEFIYVLNSPELAEKSLKEARAGTYGLRHSPNSGFVIR